MAKILVVDDDINLANLLKRVLLAENHHVDVVNEGQLASEHLASIDYDLIVFDWELPGVTGVELCRAYRSKGGVSPVLFLTGKNSIDDKDVGFEVGADDYLTKPFNMREFQMRIRALLRRPRAVVGNELKVGDIVLNRKNHEVTKNGEVIRLLPREFALLEFLMLNRREVFTADALILRLWSTEAEIGEGAVRQTMSRLRAKISADGKDGMIKTIPGVGYMLDG